MYIEISQLVKNHHSDNYNRRKIDSKMMKTDTSKLEKEKFQVIYGKFGSRKKIENGL